MKNLIKKFYKETYIGKLLITPLKKLYNYYKFHMIPEDIYLRKTFKKILGYKLDLDNPKNLNEKFQWLKIHDRTPLHTQCADKYEVRSYVKEKIGDEYLIPLLYQTYNEKNIISNNLPDEPFVIKTNHDSGGGIIIKNKKEINWKNIQKELKERMKINYYYSAKEWQYKNIKPCIIVEKLLLDENNEIPNDYKLHCFNGKVEIIQVDTGRFTNHERYLYDRNWNLIDCQWLFKSGTGVVEKPLNINEMVKIAEKLSENFIFARIDLYSIANKIYFGEITFHPGSGWEFIKPVEFDYKFGEMLLLEQPFIKSLDKRKS